MKRKLLATLTLLVILFSVAWAFTAQEGNASKTLVVPTDYPTITQAIDHASQGDVITVKQGIYNENLRINKTITLQGENNQNTVIIGKGGPDQPAVLTLAATGIIVEGFTIQSTNSSIPSQVSSKTAFGINIQGDGCTITNNIIRNNYHGIFCACQSYTTITNNIITASIKDGIRFYSGTLNTISNNTIVSNAVSGIALGGYTNTVSDNILQKNTRGIGLGASTSVVFHNTMVSNTESGIFLSGSKNIISANQIEANKYGIYITTQGAAPSANKIYQNNFVNNYINAYGNSSYLVESWDDGASIGNYWSDHQTAPYMINSNNTDNYPITSPFDISNPGKAPSPIAPAPVTSNGVVALWTFDNIPADGVIPDSTGNNPAVLASTVGNVSFIPAQVQGKFGEALSFDGAAYAFVPPSASLQTPQEVKIDAWVNIQQIKENVAYNNIIVECLRTSLPLPTRTLGLAVNGETPQNASSPPIAALRGYVMTEDGVLNEIDSKEPLPLNQWIHVVFTRSLTTGMHIYINEQEQNVTVFSGVANPSGAAMPQNELYIGHDSITQIDELQISNTVGTQTLLWMQWWFWTAIIGALAVGALLFNKRTAIIKQYKTRKMRN